MICDLNTNLTFLEDDSSTEGRRLNKSTKFRDFDKFLDID